MAQNVLGHDEQLRFRGYVFAKTGATQFPL